MRDTEGRVENLTSQKLPGHWCPRTEHTGHAEDASKQTVGDTSVHFHHTFWGDGPHSADEDVVWNPAVETSVSIQAVTIPTPEESTSLGDSART